MKAEVTEVKLNNLNDYIGRSTLHISSSTCLPT